MNPLARLGVVAGALTLAAGITAPAVAATYVYNDAAGDVYAEHCTYTEPAEPTEPTDTTTEPAEPTEECTDGVEPTVREGDVIRTRIRHTTDRVIIRTAYRELSRGDAFSVHLGSIRTNENVTRHLLLFFADGMTDMMLMRPNGDEVRCRVGRTLNFTDDVIEVRIPRGCLSRPRWVKVGLGHMRMEFEETEDASGFTINDHTWMDDALSPTIGDEPVWSPRIRRG